MKIFWVPTYGIEVLLLPVSIPVDLVPANSIEPSKWNIPHLPFFYISSARKTKMDSGGFDIWHHGGDNRTKMSYNKTPCINEIYHKEDQPNDLNEPSSLSSMFS